MSADFSVPSVPFLETWSFGIELSAAPSQGKAAAASTASHQIRQLAVAHLSSTPESDTTSSIEAIRTEVSDIVANHLTSPDYRYFIADYLERPGSWLVTFMVVYAGVAGYGSFRKGLDYVYADLKSAFGAIAGVKSKVYMRFTERHLLTRQRDVPPLE